MDAEAIEVEDMQATIERLSLSRQRFFTDLQDALQALEDAQAFLRHVISQPETYIRRETKDKIKSFLLRCDEITAIEPE